MYTFIIIKLSKDKGLPASFTRRLLEDNSSFEIKLYRTLPVWSACAPAWRARGRTCGAAASARRTAASWATAPR